MQPTYVKLFVMPMMNEKIGSKLLEIEKNNKIIEKKEKINQQILDLYHCDS